MADNTATKARQIKDIDAEAARKGKGKGSPAPEAGPKKGHPVLNTMLFTSLFFFVLIVAVIALFRLGGMNADGEYQYWLDPEGYIRGPIWLFLNPEEEDREVIYAAEIADVYERDAELTELETELENRGTALDEREAALDEREDSLSAREEQVNEWIDQIFANNAQGIGNSYDISGMVKMVAEMDPKKAALMLADLDEDVVLQILTAMKPAAAGKIFDNLEADVAASIIALGFETEEYDYPDTRPGAIPSTEPVPSVTPYPAESEAPGSSETPAPDSTEETTPSEEAGSTV